MLREGVNTNKDMIQAAKLSDPQGTYLFIDSAKIPA